MRHRYVSRNGRLVELDLDAPLPPSKAPYVMSDIREYRSIVTREMITSRSEHREHLKRHGCIEVGNEYQLPRHETMRPVREDIIAAEQASPEVHAEAKAVLERATAAIEDVP